MQLTLGPSHDRRIFSMTLPITPKFNNSRLKKLWLKTNKMLEGNKIACLVSGGMDSALLYFLLLEENFKTGNHFIITPYTILRMGAENPANNVIKWIHDYYKIPKVDLNIVGDPTLPENQQVDSGIHAIIGKVSDFLYIGIIDDRPEHYIDWDKVTFVESYQIRYPFLNLQKSHIIDLYIQKNILELIALTTSCCTSGEISCGICNGCAARDWGFNQLGLRSQ